MALESNLVERFKRYVAQQPGGIVRKLHGSEYAVAGDPDMYGCIHGRMFVVELKKRGERPSDLQIARLKQWERAGCVAGWADNYDDAIAILAPLVAAPLAADDEVVANLRRALVGIEQAARGALEVEWTLDMGEKVHVYYLGRAQKLAAQKLVLEVTLRNEPD